MFLDEHNQHLRASWAAFAEPGDRNNRDRSAVVVLMLFDKSSGRGLQRRATLGPCRVDLGIEGSDGCFGVGRGSGRGRLRECWPAATKPTPSKPPPTMPPGERHQCGLRCSHAYSRSLPHGGLMPDLRRSSTLSRCRFRRPASPTRRADAGFAEPLVPTTRSS